MARIHRKRNYIRRVAIVGDGVTEKIYFEQLKQLEHIRDVEIKPELPTKSAKGGSFKKAINTAKSLVDQGYNHVYCLIDFDTVLSENKLAEFTQESKNVDSNKITVYINNPCFEAWVLVHYEKTSKEFTNCDSVCKSIAKHLNDYCKKKEYLKKKNLYKTLRPYLETHAIPNAAFLEKNREVKSNYYPRAEVYKLLEKYIVKQKKKIIR